MSGRSPEHGQLPGQFSPASEGLPLTLPCLYDRHRTRREHLAAVVIRGFLPRYWWLVLLDTVTLISADDPTMTNPEDWRSKGPVLRATRHAYNSSPKVRETHHHWRLQCPGRNRPPHIVRSYWPTRYMQMQQQWSPNPTDMYCPRTRHH